MTVRGWPGPRQRLRKLCPNCGEKGERQEEYEDYYRWECEKYFQELWEFQ
jgi:ssDNA-binding Zn-finger/Zn-ribbon topoisomerase 1